MLIIIEAQVFGILLHSHPQMYRIEAIHVYCGIHSNLSLLGSQPPQSLFTVTVDDAMDTVIYIRMYH